MDKGLRLVLTSSFRAFVATAGCVGFGRMGSGMTDNKRAKRDARERQQRTGERYVTARRRSAKREQFFEADCCANCLQRLPDEVEGLFCSEFCMQICDTVRYWRRVVRDGRIERPDVREAVQTRVAFLP